MADSIIKSKLGFEITNPRNRTGSPKETEKVTSDFPSIFIRHIEKEKKHVGGFMFICEKSSRVRDNEATMALNAVERCQGNIANWILNTSAEGFRFVERFYFSPADNRFSLLFIVSSNGHDEHSVRMNSEILATELRDILRLNEYMVFSPISKLSKQFNTSALFPSCESTNEIIISPRTFDISRNGEVVYSQYPDNPFRSSALDNFIKAHMGRKKASYFDVVVDKPNVPENEQGELKSLLENLEDDLQRKREAPDNSRSGTFSIADRMSEMDMLDLMRTVSSLAVGKAVRVRYFSGCAPSELGAGPMCFISDYVPGASYRVLETLSSFKDVNPPIMLEAWSRSGVDGSKSFDLSNIVHGSKFFGLFKMPLPSDSGVFGMVTERLRALKAPVSILSGRSDELLIGKCQSHDGLRELRVSRNELLRHLYVCGMTGTGKTTLLKRLCKSFIESGDGFTLIDPHGDLAAEVYDYSRKCGLKELKDGGRVAYLDFEKEDMPYCVDLFHNNGAEKQKNVILEDVVGMIFRMFDMKEFGGPMFEKYFRVIARTLLETGEPLTNFNKVADDKDYRALLLSRIRKDGNRDVSDMLANQFNEGDGYTSDGGMWHYITSKMMRFCDNDTLKNFVAKNKVNLDFGSLMNKKGIVIVRLATGVVPETIANIIGMIINMRLNLAAKERVRMPIAQRTPYFLVIDEFQNFVSANANFTYSNKNEKDLTSILSEARKYGLGLILANQYISQLDRGAREAIFGNVGSKIGFRIGIEDASYLAETFGRGMNRGDFADLPNYYGYASMLLNNMNIDPFTVKTMI